MLNQRVCPFAAKWHNLSLQKAFADPEHCERFRAELLILREELQTYAKVLADLVGVEGLTELEGDQTPACRSFSNTTPGQ